MNRSIVADRDLRRKWIEAFNAGELECEKLGGAHLLLHGIWAFKVNATGERTDLIFNEPISDSVEIERSAESLVLTEWKVVHSQKTIDAIASDARSQAARYTVGALGGLELMSYKFIVLVSKHNIVPPGDSLVSNVTYRHINIAVDPLPPSKKKGSQPSDVKE